MNCNMHPCFKDFQNKMNPQVSEDTGVIYYAKNWPEYLYPNSYTPIFQIIGSFMMGLLFGAYHNSYLWTFISYFTFEYIMVLATCRRVPAIYNWKTRVIAVFMGVIGILISKYCWNRDIPR